QEHSAVPRPPPSITFAQAPMTDQHVGKFAGAQPGGMKSFIAFRSAACPSALQPTRGPERSRSIFAFVVAFVAVFVALVMAAAIDPWIERADDFEDVTPTANEVALRV